MEGCGRKSFAALSSCGAAGHCVVAFKETEVNSIVDGAIRKRNNGLGSDRHSIGHGWRRKRLHVYYTHYFSRIPSPLPVLGGELTVLPLLLACLSLPSAASLSKKSCHSSARLSLLLELLAINMGSDMEWRLGVLGVRRKGESGTPSLELVPGRARPACSFCSARVSIGHIAVQVE